MPIIDLQRSLRRLGRIRMGNQVPSANNKMRPAKLDTWRLTSPSLELLESAAQLYGGEVHEWAGAPTGRQWELYTTADTLDVMIPAGDMAFSQWYEMWSGGGCQRRCDGRTEILSGEACMCPTDAEERQTAAVKPKPEACKPTTRLFVLLPRLPDLGMWHLESHGYYAAVELAGSVELLRMAGGNMVPASLRIDQRSVKRDGQTRNYGVPVIELPTLTAHTLMTGEVAALDVAEPQPALTPPAPAALAAAPVEPPTAAPAPAARQSRVRAPRGPEAPPPLPADGPLPEAAPGEVRAGLLARIAKLSDEAKTGLHIEWKGADLGSVQAATARPLAGADVPKALALIATAEASSDAPAPIHSELKVARNWLNVTERHIVDLAADLRCDAEVLRRCIVVHATDGRAATTDELVVSDQALVATDLDQLRSGALTLEDTADGPELIWHDVAEVPA